jgi:hypothetical protein
VFALDTNTRIYFFKALGNVKEALTLVTHNKNEFRRVRGLELIDWY